LASNKFNKFFKTLFFAMKIFQKIFSRAIIYFSKKQLGKIALGSFAKMLFNT